MDTRYDHPDRPEDPALPSEADLRAAMVRSMDDVCSGRVVPAADVLAELDRTIERIGRRRGRLPV